MSVVKAQNIVFKSPPRFISVLLYDITDIFLLVYVGKQAIMRYLFDLRMLLTLMYPFEMRLECCCFGMTVLPIDRLAG